MILFVTTLLYNSYVFFQQILTVMNNTSKSIHGPFIALFVQVENDQD